MELDSPELSLSAKRLIITMKRKEESFCDILAEFLEKNEKEYCEKYGIDYKKDLKIHVILHNFLRVEDYYHDSSTLRKIFKHGKKDSNPYMESTVECIFYKKMLIKYSQNENSC